LPNQTDFAWSELLDYSFVGGDFALADDIGAYLFTSSGSGSGKSFRDLSPPDMDEGLWYLLRPDCDDGSWSSGGIGECSPPGACPPGDRDGSLP
jgi:hypothetical protein